MSKRKRQDTLSALLEERPKRGRPRHKVPRQSVQVALSKKQKNIITTIAEGFPRGIKRADIPDMAVMVLSARMNQIRRAMAGRDRELPEGITDIESLYFLWDLNLPDEVCETKWTSLRLSPNQVVEFGRLQGTFNAMFGVNRSQVFALALTLLDQHIRMRPSKDLTDLDSFEQQLPA